MKFAPYEKTIEFWKIEFEKLGTPFEVVEEGEVTEITIVSTNGEFNLKFPRSYFDIVGKVIDDIMFEESVYKEYE